MHCENILVECQMSDTSCCVMFLQVKSVVDTVMDVLASANKKLAKSTFLERNTTIKTQAFTASIRAVEPSSTIATTVSNDAFAVSFPPALFSGVPADESNEFRIQVLCHYKI